MISCSSVGTLNGYAFAMQRLAEAEQMWCQLCESETRQSIGKVLRSAFLQQGVQRICKEDDSIPTKCYTTLLDISKRQATYFNLQQATAEELPKYLKASVAMPLYNHSVQIRQNAFFDGAMIDNIPVAPLIAQPPDYIFCIYFDNYSYTFENQIFDKRIVKITFPAENRLMDSVLFRKESIEKMIMQGFEETGIKLRMLLSEGKENIEYIYRCIEMLNRQMPEPKVRLTGDVFVTNLNRIVKKFAKRRLE